MKIQPKTPIIKNLKVYGIEESIIRSGYPTRIGEPLCIDGTFSEGRLDLSEYLYGEQNTPENIVNTDYQRAKKLANTKPGTGHNNFLKGIIVQFDLKYTQYFTPQLQRYHWVDIVSSQSKMVSLTKIKDIESHCNKWTHPNSIDTVNQLIELYNTPQTEDNSIEFPYHLSHTNIIFNNKSEIFQSIISSLPMGFEMWMGISTNYLQLKTIYMQRKHHKLNDWRDFCNWIETLPMSNLITNSNG
jgi:hypothetical protein